MTCSSTLTQMSMGDTHRASGVVFNNPQVGVVGGAEKNLVVGDDGNDVSLLERVDQVEVGADVEDMIVLRKRDE